MWQRLKSFDFLLPLEFPVSLKAHNFETLWEENLVIRSCCFLNVKDFKRFKKAFAIKKLSLSHKLWIYNPHIFRTQCRKSLIFQTYIIWSNRIYSLKYQRSMALKSKNIGFRKAEFVVMTQFFCYFTFFIYVLYLIGRRIAQKKTWKYVFINVFLSQMFFEPNKFAC